MKKRMVFLAALALWRGAAVWVRGRQSCQRDRLRPSGNLPAESQASLAGNQDGEESGPVESPPYLRVSSGDSDVQAARSTYSWMITNEDGTGLDRNGAGPGPCEHGEAAALAGRRRNGGAFLGWSRAGQRVRGGRSRKPVDRLRRRPACGMRWGKLPAGGGGVGLHGTRHLGQLRGLGRQRLVLCGNYRIAAGKEASHVCIENTILKAKAVAFSRFCGIFRINKLLQEVGLLPDSNITKRGAGFRPERADGGLALFQNSASAIYARPAT